MKIKGKFITFVLGMFLLFFALPMTAKADELPTTSDGKEVVLTDFEILDENVSLYEFESIFPSYDIYEDMFMDIPVKGIQYRICYTVDGIEYESTGTITETNDEDGVNVDHPGITGIYDGLKILISWKNYSTKEVEGETYYVVNTKSNALICKCGDKTVEVPVKFNEPSPVEKIVILENPWKDGVYGYKYYDTILQGKFDGLKIKIVYSDGREAEVVECSEDGISNYNAKSEYIFSISEESSGDGRPGEDFTSSTITVSYMGVKKSFEVSLLQNPVKKLELIKNPKKMMCDSIDDPADLYGAKIRITYNDGTKETVNIKTHKSTIPVKNKYNESMKVSSGASSVRVEYMGATLFFDVPIDISSFGKAKAITAGKSKTETITASAPTTFYSLTAKKTGRYQMDFSGKRINLKTGNQKGSTEYKVYVIDEDGYVIYIYEDWYMDPGEDEIGLTKGKKYYFYVSLDSDQFYSGSGSVIYKHEFTTKLSYVGGLVEQNITASDITKKYSKDSFFMDAKAESGAELSYSSSNTKVATITKDGEVKIKGIGTTEITINAPESGIYKAATKTIILTVTKGDANLKVENSSYTKALGSKAFKLGATAETDITYKSSNTKVATVNSKGKVTIKGCGKATITITAGDEKYKKATKKVTIKVVPKTAKIKTAKSKKAGQLTVTWSEQKEAKGYVIEYSTDENFKKNVKTATIKKNGTVSKTLKNLKKGTVYYVRVKAYIEIDGKKVYGESSKVKSVTVK